MLNVLRLRSRFDLSHFEARTGLSRTTIEPQLRHARDKGLLEETAPGSWRATDLGARFLNELQALFLPG